MSKPLTHRTAAFAQVGLSYFFLAGFFAALLAEGLGYIKLDVMGQLAPMAMLVLSFWFQRQRESAEPQAAPPTTPAVPASIEKVNS